MVVIVDKTMYQKKKYYFPCPMSPLFLRKRLSKIFVVLGGPDSCDSFVCMRCFWITVSAGVLLTYAWRSVYEARSPLSKGTTAAFVHLKPAKVAAHRPRTRHDEIPRFAFALTIRLDNSKRCY